MAIVGDVGVFSIDIIIFYASIKCKTFIEYGGIYMCNQNQAYQKLEKSLTDVIAEEQAKLGYRKEAIQLYYPLGSLNHFFNSNASVDSMKKKLNSFCDFSIDRLGIIKISYEGERFCFHLAPEASEYVHKNYEKNVFIFELVELLQRDDTTLNSVISFFKKWDENCIVKEMDNGEFDVLIMFMDREDPYYYCFKDEGCHIIYHRFLPEDYRDFGF